LEDIDKSVLYDGPGGAKGNFKRASEIGGIIAKTAWNLAKTINTQDVSKLKIAHEDLLVPTNDIPLKSLWKKISVNALFKFKFKLLMSLRKIGNLLNYNFIKTKDGYKLKTEIQVIQVNDILFPTLPGEFFINLGEKILQNSPTKNTFIIELANDCAGYFFSIPDYIEGGYEPVMSLCPLGGTYISNKLIKLINKTYEPV